MLCVGFPHNMGKKAKGEDWRLNLTREIQSGCWIRVVVGLWSFPLGHPKQEMYCEWLGVFRRLNMRRNSKETIYNGGQLCNLARYLFN